MNKFKEIKETHSQGVISFENIPDSNYMNGDLGIKISKDGKVWVCINGVAFLRFNPKIKESNMVSFPGMKNMAKEKIKKLKREKVFGMVNVEMTDHEFANFLGKKDPNWTWDSIDEFNRFIANGKVIAVVKYKNDYPIGRKIWVNKKDYLEFKRIAK